MSWLDSESDVAEGRATVTVYCPTCGRPSTGEMPVETVRSLCVRDGKLIDEVECSVCLPEH